MPHIVENLPWVVLWVVALLMQGRFFRKKNTFGSLILLWLTLVIGVFWNKGIGLLAPGAGDMWLFGTKIWILFLILALRHYFNLRKERRSQAVKPREPAPGVPPDEEENAEEEQKNREE